MLESYTVWVKIENLHLALWNVVGNSKLAILIGKPLDMDEKLK